MSTREVEKYTAKTLPLGQEAEGTITSFWPETLRATGQLTLDKAPVLS
ncbi:MAG TPA: hypothetical protein PKK31_06050 [Elusimicrobiales bacterium]|nr:hypothetical protein [Elusimicrobiales bacterium]